MEVIRLVVGPLRTNCYVVYDPESGKCAVIDPGGDGERILEALREKDLSLEKIICTHGHLDHIYDAGLLQKLTGAPVIIGEKEKVFLEKGKWMDDFMDTSSMVEISDYSTVREGDIINVGNVRLHVIETPGHTPGSISLYYAGPADGSSDRALFSGDLIFRLSVGRTDLPGGDTSALLESIHRKVLTLPDDTVIYPGHNLTTTVGKERLENPFLT
ncbi:MAG TPA: MBL fold metallo-hydrolase [Bacillota bacterium]|jgi:glyoxylase-like metal-dependent hydrolase (beta-lactamase superfamily II)|nr:MBL fold metallo-hydrolase [Candidatus Fermentithermobacillaceae bacterium]HOB30710.1 MBL fold metallo-hydrolase [Bacillota bacterium]HOK64566.1 MBL fold metallo-hydrolase [Bacillota bacterium]HOL12079.1 MBL fold metallo-hydrolase [Bacillota bacterium]HOQ03085.1 MBL fold metallo-hydrolase [Bacillota bacterium]